MATALTFDTFLLPAEGQPSLSRLTISVDSGGLLVARIDGRRRLVLRDRVASIGFDYLPRLGLDAKWLNTWTSTTSLPSAVRLRVAGRGHAGLVDTCLVRLEPSL